MFFLRSLSFTPPPASNSLNLVESHSKQITDALAVQLTEHEREVLARRFTNDAEAYDLYLRANDMYRVKNRETVYQSRKLLQEAIDLDPKFSAAYARLSHTYNHAYEVGWEGPESLDRAVELAEKAVALNESSPEAHEHLGFMYFVRSQYDPAIAEVERALALDPQFARGYARLAEILSAADKPEEAIPLAEKAMSIEPYFLSYWYQYILGVAYHMLGQYDRAIDNLTRCLAKDPEFYPALTHLASVYGQLGKTNEAEAAVARLLQVDPETSLETEKEWRYADEAFMQRFLDGLRKAGLPE
jgi:adenylate cyclase